MSFLKRCLSITGLVAGLFILSGCAVVNLPKAEQAQLAQGHAGDFLHLPEMAQLRAHAPIVHLTETARSGPALLFSDMPEYIGLSNGIALCEQLKPGPYRLYVYHVPGIKTAPKNVTAVVRNLGTNPLHVVFTHYAFPAPGVDYAAMGVNGLIEFFTGTTLPPPLTIAPGQSAMLDSRLDQTLAADPLLVHAFYEFKTDQPAQLSVLQKNADDDATNIVNNTVNLPRRFPGKKSSGAGRGLFPMSDVSFQTGSNAVIDTAGGVRRLLLADGRRDPWILGRDGLNGPGTVTNKGSYGLVYHVRVEYRSSDGRTFALLVGAAGDRISSLHRPNSSGHRMPLAVDHRNLRRHWSGETRPMAALHVNDGLWPGGWKKIEGPSGNRTRGTVAIVQEFLAPSPGKTQFIDFIYSPPGGSSLPTPLYLVPFNPTAN